MKLPALSLLLLVALLAGCQSARTGTQNVEGNESVFQHASPEILARMEDQVIANDKFYYVFGFGIARQGRSPWTGRDTVLSALVEAGFHDGAWPQQVRVSRPGKNDRENATVVIDFDRIGASGIMNQNYLIHKGDIVHIPMPPQHVIETICPRVLGTRDGVTATPTGRLK